MKLYFRVARLPRLALLGVICSAFSTPCAYGQKPRQCVVLDRVVAVINDEAITAGEIDALLASTENEQARGDEVNLSHILVVVPENASPEQVQARRARADEAHAQLMKGADFRQVAAAFSEAPDALQGGAMGWCSGE